MSVTLVVNGKRFFFFIFWLDTACWVAGWLIYDYNAVSYPAFQFVQFFAVPDPASQNVRIWFHNSYFCFGLCGTSLYAFLLTGSVKGELQSELESARFLSVSKLISIFFFFFEGKCRYNEIPGANLIYENGTG